MTAGDLERRAKDIFLDAIELDRGERTRFIDGACHPDTTLHGRVRSLVDAHESVDPEHDLTLAVETSIGSVPAPVGREAPPPARIGPYVVQSVLGEGGFGTVYLARQTEPVERLVALKLLKRTMVRHDVVARFAIERQSMALMDHPSIASVFDAGTAEDGRPWVVMEYIDGTPITEWCDRRRATVRERLELLAQICHAVQHAHQKGVIHRDLKPTNILVTERDGRAVPKIIDFGIARAIGPTEQHERLTAEHRVIGSPAYMAPEQARFGGVDADTRTDVYALGVLMYELLAGLRPFQPSATGKSKSGTRGAGGDDATPPSELDRLLEGQDPRRPSSRVFDHDGTGLARIAVARRTDPRRLRRMLRGDLDWIARRAVEQDRDRRYPTAADLGQEIQRHLADLPVEAGPPTARYRLVKLWRRHTVAGAIVAASIIGLIAAAVVSANYAYRANTARTAAESATAEAESQRDRANRRTYLLTIQAAESALGRNDPRGAFRALRDAEPELRGWEWHYFHGAADRSHWTLAQDGGHCVSAAFSADGRRLVTAWASGSVRCTDAATGATIVEPIPLDAVAAGADISPCGMLMAASDVSGRVRVWSVPDAELRFDQSVHDERPTAMAFLADGRLASIGQDGRLVTIDPKAARVVDDVVLTVDGSDEPVGLQMVEPGDDGIVAVAGWDGDVRLRDVDRGAWIGRSHPAAEAGAVPPKRFGPGRITHLSRDHATGGFIAGTADGIVARLDGRTAEITQRIARPDILVRHVDVSPDHTMLSVAYMDGRCVVYDAATGGALTVYAGHDDSDARSAVFVTDDLVVSGARDRTLQAWSPRTGVRYATRHGHSAGTPELIVHRPTGRVVSTGWDSTARMWTFERETLERLPGHDYHILRSSLSPDGTRLVTCDRGGRIMLWDLDTRTVLAQRETVEAGQREARIIDVCWSPSGERLYTASIDGDIQMFEGDTLEPLGHIRRHEKVQTIAISPDGRRLASAGRLGVVQVGLAELAAEADRVFEVTRRVEDLDWSGDDGLLLAARNGGRVSALEPDDGREVRGWSFGRASLTLCVARSPDGTMLAAGSNNGVVLLMRTDGSGRVRRLDGHLEPVTSLAWLPDSSRFVSASRDGTARLWSADDGEPLAVLRADAVLHTVTVSSDGRTIVTGGEDRLVRMWTADDA